MHSKNLNHKDIDPKNIMIRGGVIKIADFGFSSHLNTKSQFANSLAGKFLYSAPEVFTGEDYSSHQADVFSDGCIMFFLATCKDTFNGGSLHAVS